MPTYEYKCTMCGHHFEEFQGINDAPISICPECGGQVRRLIGIGAGVIFRGSGFYTTDYARSDYGSSTRCGRDRTCCGRDEPCASPPCDD